MKATTKISLCLMIIACTATGKDTATQFGINKKKVIYKNISLIKKQGFPKKPIFLSLNDPNDPSKKDKTKGRRSYTITPTNPYFT